MKPFFLIIGGFLGLMSCESDDICSDKVITPRLIMRIYDKDAKQKTKSVNNLLVLGKGHSKNQAIQFSTSDSIVIPLKMLQHETTFVLVKDAVVKDNVIESGEYAELKVTYQPKQVFADKGCGYKVIYENISVQVPSSWISSTKVIDNQFDNEKKATIHIFY